MTLSRLRLLPTTAVVVALVACGGGGGRGSGSSGGSGSPPPPTGSSNVVSLQVQSPAEFQASNSNAEFVYTISNTSSVIAQDVALKVQYPATIVSGSFRCEASAGGQCPGDSQSTSVASLASGGTLKFTLTVLFAQNVSGSAKVSGSVTASNDKDASDNAVESAVTLFTADVNVAGSTSASEYMSGDNVPYTFTVSNIGPDTAHDLVLDHVMSDGQSQTSIACTASTGATCPATGPTMNVASLAAGATLTFNLTTRLGTNVLASASDTFTATLQGDPNAANNRATASARTREPTSAGMPSFVHLKSDVGDFVGAGQYYAYDQQNSAFSIEDFGADSTRFQINGDADWDMLLMLPRSAGQIVAGSMVTVSATAEDSLKMLISADGRSCSLVTGWLIVDGATYAAGQLTSLDLRFERHCDGAAPALRGQVHLISNDSNFPPGPVNPPPVGLWSAPVASVPTSGNYVYVDDSDPNDWVGHGTHAVYTPLNSLISANAANGLVSIGVNGANLWGFDFKGMTPLAQLQTGYYAIADLPYPQNNPSRAGMSFSGDGHVCLYVEGWFVIDNAVYQNGALVALDARFQQHCDDDNGITHGQIRWRSDDLTQPPGPGAPPANLWNAPANVVPATGNFVYLDSDTGDFIGGGIKKLYTPLDSVFQPSGGITSAGNRFVMTLNAEENWSGVFQGMQRLTRLEPGYYPDVIRWVGNPATGGMEFDCEGRGCNELDGWFAIDEITYDGDTLTSIDLRFEQHCENRAPALHGRIRWSASDTRTPTGPQTPPAGLWAPPGGAVPGGINSVYLESSAGDFVGDGKTYLYTAHNATFPLSITGQNLDFEVWGEERWKSQWAPMAPRTHLAPGYYDLTQGLNVAKGEMFWLGEGRSCDFNLIRGWFVVDAATYDGDTLTSLDLRFEQRCSAFDPPLRGAIHWRADDPTVIPGPQYPVPSGLWQPPANIDPGSGNLLYIEADAGDYASGGGTFRFVDADSNFDSRTYVDGSVGVGGQKSGDGFLVQFDRMASLARLQPGYYANAEQLLLHNPTVPGMDIRRLTGGACLTVDGWFVVDSITYTDSKVTAIDARFEQRCNGSTAVLHGRVRWSGVSQ